ncbi:MAG: flavodoxin-dependent (E)-4-hydroxy-3-methylbut-2-enyl-diphosphate synthase [Clostridia bacterium]|nr:flavodoxin-dependent (E)-4-hydroxy-3-methylbut-2-enyl-diphosphate synthase [Clostridia bacterium]
MSRVVQIGDIKIGGGNPIAIQSMTNCDSRDEKALLNQICELTDNGCEIVRVAIPDMEAADNLLVVKKKLMAAGNRVPLVADIHFDYKLAVAAMKNGADKVRINPGNIGSIENVKKVVDCAKERNIPIRVGVNSGSLEKKEIEKYSGVSTNGLVESAVNSLKIIEDLGYDNLVVSIKSTDILENYGAHKLLVERTDHPLHIGITESGTLERGKIKSAIGIGALLLNGIGDTMRVSLTSDPVNEVIFAKEILRALGLMKSSIELISCPTCGRTRINLEKLANEVEEKLKPVEKEMKEKNLPSIKVAVMGCAVNGPGEAREADFGVAGGKGEGLLFRKGEILRKVPEDRIVDELISLIKDNIR